MDEIYPWDWLNSRYQSDDLAQFTLVLDAVEDAARRCVSSDAGELRLGLIVTDYVADVLLARRIERLIMLSERAGWGDPAMDDYDNYDEAYRKLCQSSEAK